jgi:hypothetical protein
MSSGVAPAAGGVGSPLAAERAQFIARSKALGDEKLVEVLKGPRNLVDTTTYKAKNEAIIEYVFDNAQTLKNHSAASLEHNPRKAYLDAYNNLKELISSEPPSTHPTTEEKIEAAAGQTLPTAAAKAPNPPVSSSIAAQHLAQHTQQIAVQLAEQQASSTRASLENPPSVPTSKNTFLKFCDFVLSIPRNVGSAFIGAFKQLRDRLKGTNDPKGINKALNLTNEELQTIVSEVKATLDEKKIAESFSNLYKLTETTYIDYSKLGYGENDSDARKGHEVEDEIYGDKKPTAPPPIPSAEPPVKKKGPHQVLQPFVSSTSAANTVAPKKALPPTPTQKQS